VAGLGEAFSGELAQGGAHLAIFLAAGEHFEGVLEGFELGFADQDAGVVAAVTGDFDASVADDDTFVQVLDGVTELRELERMKTTARH
jgi:hypothetical protein